MMLLNNRLYLIAAGVLAIFLAGFYVSGKFEDAAQAEILRQQIKANVERQDKLNTIAEATEAALLTERQKSAMLQKKWSAIRGDKDRAVCILDDDSVGLLRAATEGDAPR